MSILNKMKPLKGIQIINLGVNLPSALLAYKLRELGATVLKIEPPAGDPLKIKFPKYYKKLVSPQKVISLNLKLDKDRKALDKYLAKSHLLITAVRPRSLKGLKLEWKDLRKFRKLSHVRLVGYASPYENMAGHDLTYQAFMGTLQPPQMPHVVWADLVGVEKALLESVLILLKKKKVLSTISLAQSLETFVEPISYGVCGENSQLDGHLPYYRLYSAKTGWVALAAMELSFRNKLQSELKLAALDKVDLEKAFREKTAEEWQAWGIDKDIPIVKVKSWS